MKKEKFSLGQVVATSNVVSTVCLEDITNALGRHARGDWTDWGDLEHEETREANEIALEQGLRLLSVYHDRKGVKFWIITEADRSATTVLLPEDY